MLKYLFSFYGRSGRLSYFFFFLFWILLIIASAVGIFVIGLASPAMAMSSFVALIIVMWVSSFAITVRRLHDMNLTGWVLPFILVLSVIAGLYSEFGSVYVPDSFQQFLDNGILGIHVFVNVFYLMLLLWPGTLNINRFEG